MEPARKTRARRTSLRRNRNRGSAATRGQAVSRLFRPSVSSGVVGIGGVSAGGVDDGEGEEVLHPERGARSTKGRRPLRFLHEVRRRVALNQADQNLGD